MEYVFISHSSTDLLWAEAVCNLLEKRGVKCFLDHRDLDRTKPSWPAELVRALTESNHVVLLLTRSSGASKEVLNEIANASALGIDIIPVMKGSVTVPNELMYFIRKYEWIDLADYSQEAGEDLMCERILGAKCDARQRMPIKVEASELAEYEDSCFAGINNGGYGAGLDKCLIQNGVSGWTPGDVVLEDVLDSEFSFSSIGMPEMDEKYRMFCEKDQIRKMQARGNDRTRWMLAGIYQNRRIFLTLQRTRYSMTSFWWQQVRGDPAKQKEMARRVFDQDETFFPNSFCLHLILETQDGLLLCTKVSNNKKNDYGGTLAITVGEQLSEIDFADKTCDNDQFVHRWVKRTMIEEFNFRNEDYEKYVEVSSVRVLALSYEGDIYNFALPVFARLRMDYEGLLRYLNATNKSLDEFTDIVPMTAEQAMNVVRAWKAPDNRDDYHPSSYLRALLYAAYKGADR